jgi:NarL family two-component system response regulator LiaR
MIRTIWIYALALGVLVFALKWLELRFFVRDISLEFYVGILAIGFTTLGIWVGLRFTRKKAVVQPFERDAAQAMRLELSKRELEVLELLALGHSNQEIADRLFVSLNTIKTHTSNLFSKLGVSRRTQAVQKGKELRLIP